MTVTFLICHYPNSRCGYQPYPRTDGPWSLGFSYGIANLVLCNRYLEWTSPIWHREWHHHVGTHLIAVPGPAELQIIDFSVWPSDYLINATSICIEIMACISSKTAIQARFDQMFYNEGNLHHPRDWNIHCMWWPACFICARRSMVHLDSGRANDTYPAWELHVEGRVDCSFYNFLYILECKDWHSEASRLTNTFSLYAYIHRICFIGLSFHDLLNGNKSSYKYDNNADHPLRKFALAFAELAQNDQQKGKRTLTTLSPIPEILHEYY